MFWFAVWRRHVQLAPMVDNALIISEVVAFTPNDAQRGSFSQFFPTRILMGETGIARKKRFTRFQNLALLYTPSFLLLFDVLVWSLGDTHRETPLVVAIRAGQASAVELLSQHGAPLDGGKSNGRLTGADGRAPTGPREKMMARRLVCGTIFAYRGA